jgi:hypothetical protein
MGHDPPSWRDGGEVASGIISSFPPCRYGANPHRQAPFSDGGVAGSHGATPTPHAQMVRLLPSLAWVWRLGRSLALPDRRPRLGPRPPPPSDATEWSKRAFLSGNLTPSANCLWRAEGGGEARKSQTPAFFWPSANSLAWREGAHSAPRGGCYASAVGRMSTTSNAASSYNTKYSSQLRHEWDELRGLNETVRP